MDIDCFKKENEHARKGIINFENGNYYEGEFIGEKTFHGYGVFKFLNKYTYEGLFQYGKACGQGRIEYQDGDIFEGKFKDNNYHGKGTLTQNGDIYQGEWECGKKKGKFRIHTRDWDGCLDSKDFIIRCAKDFEAHRSWENLYNYHNLYENIYFGETLNKKYHGRGKIMNKDSVYVGRFYDGYRTGYGQQVHENGHCYKGLHYQNEIIGNGLQISNRLKLLGKQSSETGVTNQATIVYSGGKVLNITILEGNNEIRSITQSYKGFLIKQYENSSFQSVGESMKKNQNNGTTYVGSEGQFTYLFDWNRLLIEQRNAQQETWGFKIKCNSIYYGICIKGVRQIYGIMKRQNNIYIGEWYNNKQDGYGTCNYKDGSIYTGEWVSGKKHGFGVLTRIDGVSQEGIWIEDQNDNYQEI